MYSNDRFGYDAARDVWPCPADKLPHPALPTGRRGRPNQHQDLAACLTPDEDHRRLRAKDRRSTGTMRFELRLPDARRRYARPEAIVEPIFGQLKDTRGFTTLSLRGLARAVEE